MKLQGPAHLYFLTKCYIHMPVHGNAGFPIVSMQEFPPCKSTLNQRPQRINCLNAGGFIIALL